MCLQQVANKSDEFCMQNSSDLLATCWLLCTASAAGDQYNNSKKLYGVKSFLFGNIVHVFVDTAVTDIKI